MDELHQFWLDRTMPVRRGRIIVDNDFFRAGLRDGELSFVTKYRLREPDSYGDTERWSFGHVKHNDPVFIKPSGPVYEANKDQLMNRIQNLDQIDERTLVYNHPLGGLKGGRARMYHRWGFVDSGHSHQVMDNRSWLPREDQVLVALGDQLFLSPDDRDTLQKSRLAQRVTYPQQNRFDPELWNVSPLGIFKGSSPPAVRIPELLGIGNAVEKW